MQDHRLPLFHLAFPVDDLAAIRHFYHEVLQCEIGRESERWIDFNFFGHQITAHLDETCGDQISRNNVDDKAVPVRHFGVIMPWCDWDDLVSRLNEHKINFYIEPYTRFVGKVGEQRTLFIQDPSENFLEFKSFQNQDYIFERSEDE